MKKVIFTVGTVTYSIKCKKLFSKNGIEAKVIKINPGPLNKSCTYGIEVSQNDFYSAIAILKESGIGYSIYNGE